MGTIERYDRVVADFATRLAPLQGPDFERPSPCEGWSAGELVDHTIGTLTFVAGLAGTDAAPDEDAPRTERFGTAAATLRGLLADEAVARRVLDTPFGTLALKQLVSSVVVHDVLVHTWDLARATGGDEELDEALCAHTLESMTPFDDMLRGHGFGPKLEAPEGASAQVRMLCFLGRRP